MKNVVVALLSLLVVSSAFAVQSADTKAQAKQKASAVNCSTVDDLAITANVKEKLSKTASLKDAAINVETKSGVVTLTGRVKTGGLKGIATIQTKRVACVQKVDNQLAVEQSKGSSAKNKNAKSGG
jgi:osmotically-inducible protein OsmY